MSAHHSIRTKRSLIHDTGFQRYFTGQRWDELNRQFFDGLAPKYDRLNDVLSLGRHQAIKRRAVERLPPAPAGRILDLCTGSGDIAIMLSRRYPDAEIVALDASAPMLRIAREKAAGLSNIQFIEGDALATGLADESFDGVFIGFGLRNLGDIDAGLAEMARVLRPGGWLSILDLGKPRGPLRQALYQAYFERLMPFLGRHIFHRGEFNSFAYLPRSNRDFPAPRELAARLSRRNFQYIEVYEYFLGGIAQQIGQKLV